MSLSEITIPSKTIPCGGGSFVVWPVSMEVIALLAEDYKEELKSLFVVTKNSDKLSLNNDEIGKNMISKAPDFVAALIAASAGEPELKGKVAKLPLPVQLESFTSIIELTVESSGGLKKFSEQVMEAIQLVTGMLNLLNEENQS